MSTDQEDARAVRTSPAPGPGASAEPATANPARPEPRPRQRWTARLPLLMAIAWLAYTVAHLALSGRMWLGNLTDLTPPLLFALAPLALLALARWSARPRRWTVLTAVGSLLLGAATGQLGLNWAALAAPPDPAPAGAGVRIFSWNAEYWDQRDDTDHLYRYLTARKADVYLLQEYFHWVDGGPRQIDQLADIKRALPGYHLAIRGEFVTASRFPIVRVKPLVAQGLPPDLGPWHDFYAIKTLRTDLRVNGRVMSVYNVHVQTPIGFNRNVLGSTFYAELREQYIRRTAQFRALAEDIRANSRPVFVAGDFNSSPHMGDMREMRSLLTDVTSAHRSFYPVSFPARGFIPRWWRLDWVFVNSGVRVHRYAFQGMEGLSDHQAQSVLISLSAPKTRPQAG